MGRGDPAGGRPPVDGRIRARVLGLAVEHPDWGSRRITRAVGGSVSRRSVQRWLAAEGLRGSSAVRDRAAAYVAEEPGAGVMGQADGFGPADRRARAWQKAALTAMTEEDHRRFEAYRGAIYESPAVWWGPR